MIVIVATTEDQLDDICSELGELGELGVSETGVASPGGARRLVLASLDDETAAWRVAADLRAEGKIAVARPDGGVRSGAWTRHTEPITFGDRLTSASPGRNTTEQTSPMSPSSAPVASATVHIRRRLLVEPLLSRIKGGERVLDLGCGSGVLGLCALQLGAAEVLAIDLKLQAVAAASARGTRSPNIRRIVDVDSWAPYWLREQAVSM